MAPPTPKLVRLAVVDGATQKNVAGSKNWATTRKKAAFVVVEATTAPKNNSEESKEIKWSGDAGVPVPGKPNQRKLSRDTSKTLHIEAEFGGVKEFLDVWILWATIEIKIKGTRPAHAAPFPTTQIEHSDQLGPITYNSGTVTPIDLAKDLFVDNMGASGKVAPVATLSPPGVSKVVTAGWAFKRERWSHDWLDGNKQDTFTSTWKNDTSDPANLRLIPDAQDMIYDLDGPKVLWGTKSFETYNNFRQWIEWNGETCSEFALWYWQARWELNKDPNKQITLNDLDIKNITLPNKPYYSPVK